MAEIPRAVLSEHFQERMEGRRLRAAVFLTYQFDPGFFEQEVLPVLFDIPVSHAAAIRLVQLEDAIRSMPGQIAVYYDVHGLVAGDAGSSRLDIRRVPIRHRTGIFHAKNVLILVEGTEPDDEGHHPQTLLVASMSANLTRAGWWENVEVCHVEEIVSGGKTRLRDDILSLIRLVQRKSPLASDHSALQQIAAFVSSTDLRAQKSSEGELHTHFYAGKGSFPEFLDEVAGSRLRGAYLEIISPYFDAAAESAPLQALIDRFRPKETRVLLPRSRTGEVTVTPELFRSVGAMPRVSWARLPRDVLRAGKAEEAGCRFVHAKVYRFFSQNPKKEYLFIGSPNLTSPAHQAGGNVETGFLVEVDPRRRPEFWLESDDPKQPPFSSQPDGKTATSTGTRLLLKYHWDTGVAEAWWDHTTESPTLGIEARGRSIGSVGPLPPRLWVPLDVAFATALADILRETSFVQVHGEAEEPALGLVQEEGMSHKPSLLFHLSITDILRYWALLTAEQRVAFLEVRAPEIAWTRQGADLVARTSIRLANDTLFDRFAGVFHAFACLERCVDEALHAGNDREAIYRLFGRKYDSLGSLLDRVLKGEDTGDDVDRYVIMLCARQIRRESERSWPKFWADHADDARELDRYLDQTSAIRARIESGQRGDMPEFLDWFERWFIRRAKAVAEEGE